METTEIPDASIPTPPYRPTPPRSRASTVLLAVFGPLLSWVAAMAVLGATTSTDTASCSGSDLGCELATEPVFVVGVLSVVLGLPLVVIATVVACLGLRSGDPGRQRRTVLTTLAVVGSVEVVLVLGGL